MSYSIANSRFLVERAMPSQLSSSQRIGHYVAAEATTIAASLEKHFKLDPPQAKDLLNLGAIYQDKKRIFRDRPLKKGDYIRVHLQPKRFDVASINWKACVVHDGPDFLVVNKPAGFPVHATLDNNIENVLQQMRNVLRIQLFVTQRLDVPVSGLVVFGKTAEFQALFNRLLLERRVMKRYEAVTDSELPIGLLVHYMEPSERAPRRVSVQEHPNWQKCELKVWRCESFEQEGRKLWKSEIELLTGRTHQIRAQLGELGSPIVGDSMYGSKSSDIQANRDTIGLKSVQVGWEKHLFHLPRA